MRARTASAAGAAVVLAHVEVAVAVEFDDPRQARGEVGGELVVVDRLGGGDEEASASRRRRGAWRSRTRRSRRRSRGPGSRPAAAASRRTSSALDCAQSTRRVSLPLLCTVSRRCRKSAPASAVPTPGKRQAQGTGLAVGVEQLRRRRRRLRVGVERRDQRRRRARPQLGVLVEQQAVAARSPRASGSSRSPPCRSAARARSGGSRRRSARTASAEPSLGGVVEDEDLALDPGRVGALDRVQAGEQVLAAVRVHDAVGERGCHARSR